MFGVIFITLCLCAKCEFNISLTTKPPCHPGHICRVRRVDVCQCSAKCEDGRGKVSYCVKSDMYTQCHAGDVCKLGGYYVCGCRDGSQCETYVTKGNIGYCIYFGRDCIEPGSICTVDGEEVCSCKNGLSCIPVGGDRVGHCTKKAECDVGQICDVQGVDVCACRNNNSCRNFGQKVSYCSEVTKNEVRKCSSGLCANQGSPRVCNEGSLCNLNGIQLCKCPETYKCQNDGAGNYSFCTADRICPAGKMCNAHGISVCDCKDSDCKKIGDDKYSHCMKKRECLWGEMCRMDGIDLCDSCQSPSQCQHVGGGSNKLYCALGRQCNNLNEICNVDGIAVCNCTVGSCTKKPGQIISYCTE